MMKALLILPLFLIGCTSNPKLNQEEKILASYPIAYSQEDFNFSELLLIIKINHEEKTAEKCHGIFPHEQNRNFINNLYMTQKSQKKINYEKKLILSLKDKQIEYVIYHVSGGEDQIKSSVKACERLQVLLQQDGYKLTGNLLNR